MKQAGGIRAGIAAALVFLALGAGIGLGWETCAEPEHPGIQENSIPMRQGSASDAYSLSLENASIETLDAAIVVHPELTRISLTGSLPAPEALCALEERYPSLELDWTVVVCDIPCEKGTRDLTLSGCAVTQADLDAIAGYLPDLETLNLTGASVAWDALDAFVFEYPGIQYISTSPFLAKPSPTTPRRSICRAAQSRICPSWTYSCPISPT